jgi:peptidoglycan/LPS O-acetylase OafA/YrhL
VKDSASFWKNDWAFYISVAGSYVLLHLDIHDVLVLVFFGGVILSASLNSGRPYKFLNIKPLQFLGDISYSIYLLQLFWLLLWSNYVDVNYPEGVPGTLTNLLMLGILLTALIINAYLTYRFIEIPFQRMLRRKKPKEKIILEGYQEVEKK